MTATGEPSLGSLTTIDAYAEAARSQIRRLGSEVDVYRARFDAAMEHRQPGLVILLVAPLAAFGKLLVPRRLLGEHVLVALLLLAWILMAWPPVRIFGGLAGRLLPEAVGGPVFLPLVATAAVTLTALRGIARRGLGLTGWRVWSYTLGTALGIGMAIGALGHLLFWITWFGMEL